MKILKQIRHKAFTLAELMVILAVMTVMIAAVAPIITAKYNSLMSSEVWHEVPADNDGDIYTDGINHLILQQIMIGVSPLDLNDIKTNYAPESKLVIRASDRVNGNTVQAPIEFYHNGRRQGVFIAGKENIMLVGDYDNIVGLSREIANLEDENAIVESIAIRNTAFGKEALNNIRNGHHNTAIGYRALSTITSGSRNTAVGAFAGGTTTTGNNNVYIGYMARATGSDNTIVTNNTNAQNTSRTTVIGDDVGFAGNDNVALGYHASAGGGNNNTAVGAYAGSNSGSGNTAIGYKSCSKLGEGKSNKTCIGQAAAYDYSLSLDNSTPQVLIGRGNSNYGSAAAVVVSSSTGSISVSEGSNFQIGDASVVVYGNLIVRGQTYMYGRSPFPQSGAAFNPAYAHSLMGYTLYGAYDDPNNKPLIGLDGSGTTAVLTGEGGYSHQVYGGREHCICAHGMGNDDEGIKSYDWTSSISLPYTFNNLFGEYSYFYSLPEGASDSGYPSIELSRSHGLSSRTYFNNGSINTIGVAEGSCCPILTQDGIRRMSDSRLKNIGEKFTAGLDKLEKIKIYNFTFKSDKLKTHHVGVIAQDLKSIFPNSVSKDEKGYYKIRWDEMFYSAINSVKELNSKLAALISRVKNDFDRISRLKQENKKLEDRLIKLADEIEKLEH